MKKLALTMIMILSLCNINLVNAEFTMDANNCFEKLGASMNAEKIEFQKFLDETFRNKSSNSSLNNIAIARFTNYRLKLESLFADVKPTSDYDSSSSKDGTFNDDFENEGVLNTGWLAEYQPSAPEDASKYKICYDLMQSYIEDGKAEMIKHIKNNTAQKKTMIILEKYASINERLRDLNMEIAQMYGYFVTFKDKLHWINGKCVQ